MRLNFLIIWFAIGTTAFAQRLPVFAVTNRVISIEQWSRAEALVWAVQPNQIVVYRIFDTLAPDELVAVRPIGPEDLKRIRNAVAAIPPAAFGKLHWHGGTLHGPMVKLNFTGDGSYVDTRIEVCGVWADWLKATLDAISTSLPTDLHITFEEQQRKYQKDLSQWTPIPTTHSISIKEYYGPPNVERRVTR